MKISRGIRNNNPGNIRHGEKWKGLSDKQIDGSFCMFISAEWGIRALVKILRTYQKKYGLKDVMGIINRFAPPCENDTGSYVLAVCKALGVGKSEMINVFNSEIMLKLLKAIILHENGSQPYSDELLQKGIRLADE